MNEITQQLKKIIANDLDVNIDEKTIVDDIGLLEGGLGLDSIAVMELISILEQTFGFEFSDDDLNMDAFQTLTTLSEFVTQKTSAVKP
jgi:acyl carrier protein